MLRLSVRFFSSSVRAGATTSAVSRLDTPALPKFSPVALSFFFKSQGLPVSTSAKDLTRDQLLEYIKMGGPISEYFEADSRSAHKGGNDAILFERKLGGILISGQELEIQDDGRKVYYIHPDGTKERCMSFRRFEETIKPLISATSLSHYIDIKKESTGNFRIKFII